MPDLDDATFERIEDLLAETQLKHFELAELIGEYRRLIEDIHERPTDDAVRLARSLPGAKYWVTSEYIRQNWLKLEVELVRAFGKPGTDTGVG
jgi:hypothetical protein